MSLATGSRLGPYEILGPLGAGGMGEVYRARDPRLGRDVAVKVLPPALAADPDRIRRFEQEARAASALNHPGILTVFDVGSDGGRMFLVTELLAGRTVRAVLASGEPVPLARALDWGAQIARGLAAAHEQGIVHRDLKPENLFVGPESRIKILDFGLAKLTQDDRVPVADAPTQVEATETGAILGTPGYMAPEQVRGERVDARADLFALGCVLYELLGGRRAFMGDSAVETLHAILKQDPPPLGGLRADLSPAVVRLVDRCLAKPQAERFQSARDLAFALESAMDGSSAPRAALEAPAVLQVSPPVRRRRGAIFSVAAGLLLALAALAGWLARRTPAPGADWAGETLTALTRDPGYEAEPTFSPDGETIAYVSDRDGDYDIYLQQVSGGPAIDLSKNSAADLQPAFSPDGRFIAFVSDRESGREVYSAGPNLPLVGGGIWIMPALGGPARRIVVEGNFPSWSPDGHSIVFVHGTFRHTRIAVVAAEGGEARDLEITGVETARFFFPRFSDDGRWLLFQNGPRIGVVAPGGGAGRVLGAGERPAWGPGATIVFSNNVPGKNRTLWLMPFAPDTGELAGPPRPLTFGRGADLDAAVARDGRSIVFAALDQTRNLEELPFDEDSGRPTAPPREITRGSEQIDFFSSSADSRTLVFASKRGAVPHIWRITPPGEPEQLTRDDRFQHSSPHFSPDGRWIAYTRRPAAGGGAPMELWRMTADGVDPRRIGEISGEAAWAGTNRLIAQRSGEELVFYDIDGGDAVPFTGARVRTLFATDLAGEWLAYQTAARGNIDLEAVPLAGGKPRTVVATPAEDYHPFFSPSGRWLYFQPDHKNLFRVPGPAQQWLEAPPQRVTDFPAAGLYLEDPQISRDGSQLLYTRGRTTADLWLLRLSAPEPIAPAR